MFLLCIKRLAFYGRHMLVHKAIHLTVDASTVE